MVDAAEHLGTDRGHRVLDLTVKRGRRRRIPLLPVVAHDLDEMLIERRSPADGPLFVEPSGRHIYGTCQGAQSRKGAVQNYRHQPRR
ncbi:hypothetical protein E1258_07525 [Micromonospora sp. KC207]|uniref:hypothetical protein n=1 Tax=Micromonospora sp. KC207 TaxID=2530377 RepID=UPI001043E5F1|nr:hypothetical protein [Micromonospora sp. KC207]TDC64740.1 hypothetical protein E1258_07525 [Micromonospora sp. KC207]